MRPSIPSAAGECVRLVAWQGMLRRSRLPPASRRQPLPMVPPTSGFAGTGHSPTAITTVLTLLAQSWVGGDASWPTTPE